ncbi:MAG: serine/threonine-protein kinase, partial [Gemmatimonadales bacterium]
MPDLLERLTTALADRYRIERELGRGGMAIVYLAHDLKHDRQVAIKVLKSELATSLGPERFQREIQVAAGLSHPNILPLYDSGEVNGLFYYVMPYIEGESLADRLERDTQLPIAEAVDITRQVAAALAAAHRQGVVHRDIKPDNILLDQGRALVADFGIAHAIDAAGGEKLTQTGIAVGTPTYMSPEQSAGERRLDGRADIYSLGCVLYEMLIGEPPFTGPSMQVVFARHAMEDVPSLVTARRTIPEPIEEAVLLALSKAPADRYQNADEFAAALDTDVSVVTRSRPGVRPQRKSNRGWVIGAGVAVIALAVWAGSRFGGSASAAGPLDRNLIAVLPFRVIGSGDQQLQTMASGVVELMYYRLPGNPGPTVVYPATIQSALGERAAELTEAEALDVARDVGAGSVLLGQMWDLGGDRLRLSATLHDVTDASVVARVDNIEGSTDSVVQLVDRLAGELLVREAGVEGLAAGSLLSTDLPALRQYLAGQAAYGRGQYLEAATH